MKSSRSTDPEPASEIVATEHRNQVALALVGLAAVVLLHVGFVLFRHPEIFSGAQIDGDGYLRLVRVGLLLDGAGWFSSEIARSNWPFGEVIHWTRPLDLLIVALSAPFMPVLGRDTAVALAGSLVSPLLYLAVCASTTWAVRPLVAARYRHFVLLAILAQPGLFVYGTAGRADHHILVLFLSSVAMGAWVRVLMVRRPQRNAVLAASVAAATLWVSPEGLIPLAAIFLSGGFLWAWKDHPVASINLRFCGTLLLGLLIAILLERPPSQWLAVEYDRISVVHLTMAAIACGFWLGVHWWLRGVRSLSPGRRFLLAGLGGVAAAVLLHVLHPGFFEGPSAAAAPIMDRIFFPYVDELRSIVPTDLRAAGGFFTYLGSSILVLPMLGWLAVSERDKRTGPAWIYLAILLLIALPLAATQIRLVGHAGVVLAVGLAVLLERWSGYLDRRMHGLAKRVVRPVSILALTLGVIAVGGGLTTLADPPESGQPGIPGTLESACTLRSIEGVLNDPQELGSHPRTIAISINLGPEILYRTPHRILSGPYHRNDQGMLALHTLFTSGDLDEVRRIVEDREIDLVLLCPDSQRGQLGGGPEESLFRRLDRGDLPDWARRVALPSAAAPGLQLYELQR